VGALAGAGLVCPGCAKSKPSRFYLLAAQATSDASSESGRSLTIALGPVTFPEYLDRPQIVTRSADHRLELAEFDRWAEPLKPGALRVLAENLATLLGTQRVTVIPQKEPAAIDFRVSLEVLRLDGKPGQSITLVTRWAVFRRDGTEAVPVTKSVHVVETSASGYEGFAAAMSDALARFAREIADAMKRGAGS